MMRRRPRIRFAIAALALAGCSAPSASSPESMDRMQALHAMGESGRQQDVPRILPSLSSEDPLVRWTAQRALLSLTGTTNGYDWAAPRTQRNQAFDAWVQWCRQRGLVPAEAR
jgi:hypothetical protein